MLKHIQIEKSLKKKREVKQLLFCFKKGGRCVVNEKRRERELYLSSHSDIHFIRELGTVRVPIACFKGQLDTLHNKKRVHILQADQQTSLTYRIKRVQIKKEAVYIHFDQNF